MEIGYSPETLWTNIFKQLKEIQNECDLAMGYRCFAVHYNQATEIDCVEDCARNIIDSCKAIFENIENLKGEKM